MSKHCNCSSMRPYGGLFNDFLSDFCYLPNLSKEIRELQHTCNDFAHEYDIPDFVEKDGKYEFRTSIDKKVEKGNLEINIVDREISISSHYSTENGKFSTSTSFLLPKDLDVDTLKAKRKNNELILTAEKKKVEEKKNPPEDIEYEIEINR